MHVFRCFLLLWVSLCCLGLAAGDATLVLHNGKVVTVEKDQPQVQAIAVKGDRILALGSNDEIKAHMGDKTRVIDLQGKLVIPGFIEGHAHFLNIGFAKTILDLRAAKSWDDIVTQVAQAVAKAQPGELIQGRGWHQDKWNGVPADSVEGIPVHKSLSEISQNNPVILTHASGHGALVNARALSMSGVDAETPDPAGGQIVHDKLGNPTGFLREKAIGLIKVDSPSEKIQAARTRKWARLASQECLSKGITSFQDAGSSYANVDLFKALADEYKLGLRLWVMIRASNEEHQTHLANYRTIGYGNNHLTVRAIKLSIDGALGSRGAWLLEPYTDAPHLRGLNLLTLDSVKRTAQLAMQHNYQLGIHAIGDRGNKEVLDIYQAAFKANPNRTDPRWRVEHAQHLHPEDIPRFGKMGVIASMQAVHCTSDGPWVPDRLGDQRSEQGAYVWQKLKASGAVVTNGTDAPVEDVSAIASYYSAVSRMMNNGKRFYESQRMSRIEALESYTINPAFAAHEDHLKGSLKVGKLADMVILSQDILTVPEADIPKTEVLTTIVGGSVLYSKK